MTTATNPLVTFALFAYNQEKFIIDALQGALAQTYSPLQIIVSDDCSSDRTFDLVKKFLHTYKSSHEIILNRNDTNIGIAQHVRKIASLAKGSIIIFAAGDDISEPFRTSSLVSVFATSPRTMAIFSDAYLINESNKLLGSFGIRLYRSRSTPLRRIVCKGGGIGSGATYAYRAICLTWPWMYPPNCNSEDKLLPLRAALLGTVLHVPFKLVKVRKVSTSYSHSNHYIPAICSRAHQHEIALSIIAASKQGLIKRSSAYYLVNAARQNPVMAKRINDLNSTPGMASSIVANIIDIRRDKLSIIERVYVFLLRHVLRKNSNILACD